MNRLLHWWYKLTPVATKGVSKDIINDDFQFLSVFAIKHSTIIIPNIYREDYLSSLRALTRRDRPEPLIKMLARAHSFSNLDFSIYKKALQQIEIKNWFREASEAKFIQ